MAGVGLDARFSGRVATRRGSLRPVAATARTLALSLSGAGPSWRSLALPVSATTSSEPLVAVTAAGLLSSVWSAHWPSPLKPLWVVSLLVLATPPRSSITSPEDGTYARIRLLPVSANRTLPSRSTDKPPGALI